MSAHTPGPWKSDGAIAGWWGKALIAVRVTCERIPGLSEPIALCPQVGIDEQEILANARLIAAAPLMLDVLKRVADAIESLDGTSVENERLVDDYRAVIMAATGECT